ncbi:hypothetical protein TrVFT333_004285 [Trichoderma virens FT-333]|nr:hypothetical protein TrVFT333_004285 [Trichoderma virens FT-333]
MFDDNAITEADFNFFDEKPGDMDADIPMADMPSSEMALPPPPQPVEETPERVVFAKPELKHARSQNEDPTRRSRGEIRVTPVKRESSPFDPHAVFKRVKASLKIPKYDSTTSSQPAWRKAKIFESLDFDPALPMINKKYEQGGLFDLSALSKVEKMEKPNIDLRAVPETDYLKRHGKLNRKPRERPITRSTMAKQYSVLEPQMSTTSPMKLDGSISGEDSSVESDQDDSSYTSDEPGSPHKASIRLINADDDILSQITSLRDCDIEEPDHQLAMELPRLSKSDMTGVPLSALFSDPEPLLLDMALNDDDLIQIAQIVTEQAATGGLDIFRASDFETATLSASQKRQELLTHSRDSFHTLEEIVAQFFGDTMPMRLKGLLDIQDVPLLSHFQPRQIPGREGNPEAIRPSNLYQIPSPHLEIDRITTSPDATVTGHGSAMIESMEVLRGVFTNLAITETNFVIYFVYSPDNPGTIIESSSLIRENSCIHVAYAQSVDERWITAAWTDDRGNQQATASYCMGRKGKSPSRNMNEIANEIWETTLELISAWKVLWRVIITKCGPMPQHEMDFWVDLARTEINAKVTVALLTVDTNPSLQLLPPVVRLPPPSAALHTPASTPQPSAFSPEPPTPATPAREANMTAATPSGDGGASNAGAGDADLDAILTDVTDQTWGAIAGHRLSNSMSILEVHPALISGYLIKRTGIRVEDAPTVMEVNLVYTEAMPRVHEPLFREMLGYFRGLGTLARARGVVDREADVRPWHVAAAEKAARALYLLM